MRALSSRGALLSASLLFTGCGAPPVPGTIEAFFAAVPDFRLTEARLTGGSQHRACEAPGRAPGIPPVESIGRVCANAGDLSTSTLAELSPTLRSVSKVAEGGATVGELHVGGLVELLSVPNEPGRIDAAVELLEAASARAPLNADLLNDLAVARLAQFEFQGRVTSLLAGIEAADSAVGLDPTHDAARFSLAVLLERFALPSEATREWEGYLERNPQGRWADEARTRLARLGGLDFLPEVEGSLSRWLAGESEALEEPLAREPGRVREYLIDVLLPQWAETVLQGDAADWLLAHAGTLGERLAAVGNDRSGLETVQVITGMGREERLLAAEAIEMHGHANSLYLQARYQDSAPEAAAALEIMRRLDLPIAAWAANTLAANASYAGDYAAADSLFLGMVEQGVRYGSNAMKGRGHWGYSLGRSRRGLDENAAAHRDSAAVAYQRAGEREPAGFMSFLKFELLMRQGEIDAGLLSLWMALQDLSSYRSSHRLHNTLMTGAREVSALGFHRAGLRVQLEGTPIARATGIAQFPVEAEGQLARMFLRVGSHERAAELARSARSGLEGIADQGMRNRNRADLNLVFAELELGAPSDSRVSGAELSSLDDSLAFAQGTYEAAGLLTLRLRVYPLRAALLERNGDVPGALELLGRGVSLIESVAKGLGGATARAASLDAATDLFDALIALQLRAGRVRKAFATSERARSALGGERKSGGGASALAWVGDVLSATSGSALFLEYAVLSDRVVSWLVDGDGTVDFSVHDVQAEELGRRVTEFRRALRRGDSNRVIEASEALHGLLLEPYRTRLMTADRLTIVPDKSLHGLPFAALRDPADGSFLAERLEVALVPMGSFMRVPDESSFDGQSLSSLVVGAAEVPGSGLAPLPQVAIEVRAVAAIYGEAGAVEGEVTRSRILARLGDQEVFHFAGHALFDPRRPQRSHLVVSDGVSGFAEISSADIAALDLERLRLVVLSACSTVSQKNTRTGGLQGLGQAFLAAGAGGVIGSLWPVDDYGAREFSVRLHRVLLRDGDPIKALRETQMSLLVDAESDPRLRGVWAAFQYMGR